MRKSGTFFISGYLIPPRNNTSFLDLQKSHINHIYIDYTTDENIREDALAFCDKFDINAIIMTCWSRYDNPSFKSVIKNANKHKSFVGINGLDEPIIEDFPSIFSEYRNFQQMFDDKTFYVNLVNCAVPHQFIASNENLSYENLLDEYKKLINEMKFDKTVSMTIYPLLRDEITGEPKLHLKHLQSLEYLSKIAADTNAEMYFFVQAMPFRNTHRKPSLVDLYFQVNSGLAFGAKGVQYFCYRTPDPNWEFNESQYAIVLKDGTKTDTYYAVKEVNEWLIVLAPYYLNLKYLRTFAHKNNFSKSSEQTFCEFIENNINDESIKLYSTSDLLCGKFLTKEGCLAFYFVNYGEPSTQKKNYIEFSLENELIQKILIISKFGNYNVEKYNNKFSLVLGKGEGLLVLTNAC